MQANEEGFKAPTTGRFYITDRDEPIKYRMFDNIDGLLKMRDEEEYALIHSENDMVKVFYQLTEAGYKPYIKYSNSGQIANIMCKFYYKKLKNTSNTILYHRVYQRTGLMKMWRLMTKRHIIILLVLCSDFRRTCLRKTIYHTVLQ